jgi:hypothetical protein
VFDLYPFHRSSCNELIRLGTLSLADFTNTQSNGLVRNADDEILFTFNPRRSITLPVTAFDRFASSRLRWEENRGDQSPPRNGKGNG